MDYMSCWSHLQRQATVDRTPIELLGRKYLEWTMRLRRDGKWVRQHIPKEEKQYSIIPVHLFSGRDKQ